MMSDKAMVVISLIYDAERQDFIKRNPGSNENDVERHFLYSVWSGVNDWQGNPPTEIMNLIEEIR